MDQIQNPTEVRRGMEREQANLELIDRIVERAVNRSNLSDKESYYRKQLPKTAGGNGKLSIDECIDQVLGDRGGGGGGGGGSAADDYYSQSSRQQTPSTSLRALENVDVDALLRGFETEELKDGKLVLYITEKQLSQLLKQRAVIVPNRSTTSIQDFSNPKKSSVLDSERTDLYRPTNPVSNMLDLNRSSSGREVEVGVVNNSNNNPSSPNDPYSSDLTSKDVYRTTNSLSSIAEEDRRNASLRDEDLYHQQQQQQQQQANTIVSDIKNDLKSTSDIYRQIRSVEGDVQNHEQTKTVTESIIQNRSESKICPDIPDMALIELDHLVKRISSNLRDDNNIDWSSLRNDYNAPDKRDKADLMKKYVSSLLDDRTRSNRYKSKSALETEEDKLKAVDDFVDQVLNRKKQKESERSLKLLDTLLDQILGEQRSGETAQSFEASEEALRSIDSLLNQLKVAARVDPSKCRTGNKIIIRTTRKLPAKVYITAGKNLVKKKITYSYLDNYNPTTRVYEVLGHTAAAGSNFNEKNITQTADLFNSKNGHNYLIKPFDTAIADSIGKPSVEQINKYLSVINTGIKNSDLIQIHPLLNNKTEVKHNSTNVDHNSSTFPSFKEPVMIDSEDYPKYIQDISKHFGGLQVTDFPLYVQGLEFKQHSNNNNKVSQSVVLTKLNKQQNEGIQNNDFISTQLVNNVNNVQYVRINNSTPSLVAH